MYILEKTTKLIRLCILELIGLSAIKLFINQNPSVRWLRRKNNRCSSGLKLIKVKIRRLRFRIWNFFPEAATGGLLGNILKTQAFFVFRKGSMNEENLQLQKRNISLQPPYLVKKEIIDT